MSPRVNSLPASLQPEHIIALVDPREQLAYDLSPMRMERATLPTGDYSVSGLEDVIALERKSLPDYLACCGTERDRFARELHRLLAYQCRVIIVEATWEDLERGDWRSQIKPAAVLASTYSWLGMGLPIILAGNRERGQAICARILFYAARRRYHEARSLAADVMTAVEAAGVGA